MGGIQEENLGIQGRGKEVGLQTDEGEEDVESRVEGK